MTSESLDIKRQLDLLRQRRRALRIALQLFEVATCQEEVDLVSELFEQCNISSTASMVEEAIVELSKLAQAKSLPVDL